MPARCSGTSFALRPLFRVARWFHVCTHARPHTLVSQVPAQDCMAEEVLPFRASAKASAAIAGAGLASPAACKLLHGGVLQAPTCVFSCMACLHWPGQSSGVVQVHEVKGNLSTAGLQRVFERCTAASRGPFPVQRGSGARMRGVYGCTVFTGACTVFTGARCSPVHGVHGCTMFYGCMMLYGCTLFSSMHYLYRLAGRSARQGGAPHHDRCRWLSW